MAEVELDDSGLTEEVYLSFLRDIRNEYNEYGSDDGMFKELFITVGDVLAKWYDDDIQKMYLQNDDENFEELLNKTIDFLEARIEMFASR